MIKKYFADKNCTITNAYQPGNLYRATGSNTSLSDTMSIFTIYGQNTTSSLEKARVLFSFPAIDISNDRSSNKIPVSGSCKFYLCLYNAEHPFTIPRNFQLCVSAITSSDWDIGSGLDIDSFYDFGVPNWLVASTGTSGQVLWENEGSDFYTGSYIPGTVFMPSYTSSVFEAGNENLEIDITSMVEEWVSGRNNYGMCVYLHPNTESALSSSYVKKFFGRGTEFFLKQPSIQCRWDDSIKDDRGYFYASSSLCDTENLNNVYLYNKIRGSLKTIPGVSTNIYVQVYSDRVSGSLLTSTPITGGLVSKGIYSASIALFTTSSTVYDRWYGNGLATCYATGTIEVKNFESGEDNTEDRFIISMPNLKSSYNRNEVPRLKVFTRKENWQPNVYTVASADAEFNVIKNLYYRCSRAVDKFIVYDYGTGSNSETVLSYDVSGSYFDFDMSGLEEEYAYEFSFIKKKSDTLDYEELPNKFTFRIDRIKF